MVPFPGGCRVAETDRTVARNYITALLEAGRSANTIRQAKVVLCATFAMAVADGYASNSRRVRASPQGSGSRRAFIASPSNSAQAVLHSASGPRISSSIASCSSNTLS